MRGDHSAGNHRLASTRRRNQHSQVAPGQLVSCFLLLAGQAGRECELLARSLRAVVGDLKPATGLGRQ